MCRLSGPCLLPEFEEGVMRKFLSSWAVVAGAALAISGVYQFSHRLGFVAAGLAVVGVAVSERNA